MADPTPAGELRAAAAELRTPLPPYLIGAQVRVIQGDSERMDTLAWCRVADHGDDGECENCKIVEILDPTLTRLIAGLFTAREPLAAWLENVAWNHLRLCAASDQVLGEQPDDPKHAEAVQILKSGPYDLRQALAVARVVLGGGRG